MYISTYTVIVHYTTILFASLVLYYGVDKQYTYSNEVVELPSSD